MSNNHNRRILQTNGVEKEHENGESIVEEPEEAIVTRMINGSKNAWNSIPSETKWELFTLHWHSND